MENKDVTKFLKYIEAECFFVKLWEEENRTFHIDCTCRYCKATEAWMTLSWWRKFKAKLEL